MLLENQQSRNHELEKRQKRRVLSPINWATGVGCTAYSEASGVSPKALQLLSEFFSTEHSPFVPNMGGIPLRFSRLQLLLPACLVPYSFVTLEKLPALSGLCHLSSPRGFVMESGGKLLC